MIDFTWIQNGTDGTDDGTSHYRPFHPCHRRSHSTPSFPIHVSNDKQPKRCPRAGRNAGSETADGRRQVQEPGTAQRLSRTAASQPSALVGRSGWGISTGSRCAISEFALWPKTLIAKKCLFRKPRENSRLPFKAASARAGAFLAFQASLAQPEPNARQRAR